MELLVGNKISRRAFLCLLVMVLITVEPAFLAAASGKTISEEQLPSLHAALVLKIAMFVEWPDEALEFDPDNFTLAVAGSDIVFDAFEKLSDKKINGRDLIFTRPKGADKPEPSHILFISHGYSLTAASDPAGSDPIKNLIEDLPAGVLTISDDLNFNAKGGMIQLSIENGRPAFSINISAAKDSGIKFSSKLLKIATIYKEGTS